MTKGQAALQRLLEPFGARGVIAKSIGATPTLLTHWKQGKQSPSTRYRVELERLHGIPLLSWDEPAAARPSSAA